MGGDWKRLAGLPLALALTQVQAQETAPDQTIVVLGRGQTRQVQNLNRLDLDAALPGTSALKTLDKLPGVSFQSADASGSYEWSTRIAIRGYSQGQLGFTLDGVPLGNMSYGNNNGLHISRAIISEDIRRVDVAQGAGAIGTASTSNLGGSIQFFAQQPAAVASVQAAQTSGSHHLNRTYAHIDTGQFGLGLQSSLSVARQRAEKWKGDGPQDLDQLNLRLLAPLGEHRISAFYNLSDRSETDYQDLSLDMQRRLGWDWDNYAPDWQRAVDAARGIFRGGVNNLDDGYYIGRGLRKDRLGAMTDEFAVDGNEFLLQFYHHGNDGQGHWYTPYQASSPTVPVSLRTTEYEVQRNGVQTSISRELGEHRVSAGVWLESNRHTLTRNYYAVSGPEDTNRFMQHPFLTAFRQVFDTRTRQLYVQDSMRLLDGALKVEAGAKWSRAEIDTTSINAVRAAGTLTAAKPFLPQIAATYDAGGGAEWFGSLTRSYRAFEAGVYGQFSQSQAAFDAHASALKPETAISADVGWRYHDAQWAVSAALYRTDFSDRLLSVATCAGVVGCPNTVVNVGKVRTRGLEAALVWTPQRAWSWFNSLTWNDSRYGADYVDNGQLVPVSGKTIVDAPRLMLVSELSLESGPWTARAGAKYTGMRYYTYVNDGAVPAFTVANASLSWKAGAVGPLKELKLHLNVSNLLDRRYFATIGSNQFVASDPKGEFATLLTGAPREVFVSLSGRY